MTAPNLQELVGKLSEAQRKAVLSLPVAGGYIWRHGIRLPTAKALSRLGIFTATGHYGRYFTPLGLEVRALLQEQSNER